MSSDESVVYIVDVPTPTYLRLSGYLLNSLSENSGSEAVFVT